MIKLAKMSLLILFLQGCGESAEPEWSLGGAKGDEGVATRDAPCNEPNKVVGDLVCTGQLQIQWVPSTWRGCHCIFDDQPVYPERADPHKCCDKHVPVVGEGLGCDNIGEKSGSLTCTAVKKLVIVGHKWTDKDNYLCPWKVDGQDFYISDGATFAHSAWDPIEIVNCRVDGLLTGAGSEV